MAFSDNLTDELNILIRFNLDTSQQGIKVHSTAHPRLIAAAERLHQKGMITRIDGGYLTDLGRDAAMHADSLLALLNSN